MKRSFPRLWVRATAIFSVAAAPLLLSAGEPTPRKPNLIFVLADDLGYGDLGCYGQEKIRTPCVDTLAKEGLRFTQHYSGCNVCAPSRCSLMTGLHMGHAAIRGNKEIQPEGQQPLPGETFTIAKMLKQAGYATGCVGKWGLGMAGSSGDPNAQGFDLFYGFICQRKAHNHYPEYLWRNGKQEVLAGNANGQEKEYAQDLFIKAALQFVRESRDRPFFLYFTPTIPHLALQVPEDSLAEYRGKWDDPPYEGKKGYRAHPTPRAAYAAMISRLDRDVGRLMALLKELSLDENTVVFFSSDNGPTFDIGGADSPFFKSAPGMRGLKGSFYEGGIRVPLVARWPGRIKAGTTTEHVSAFWDFLPTCAELAGVAAPQETDGVSYLPALLGKEQQAHEFLYWERSEGKARQQAARQATWKAVYQVGKDKLELFDLAADPGETTDLAEKQPEKARSMQELMDREHRESAVFPLTKTGR